MLCKSKVKEDGGHRWRKEKRNKLVGVSMMGNYLVIETAEWGHHVARRPSFVTNTLPHPTQIPYKQLDVLTGQELQ